jgi:hypothetical protein
MAINDNCLTQFWNTNIMGTTSQIQQVANNKTNSEEVFD